MSKDKQERIEQIKLKIKKRLELLRSAFDDAPKFPGMLKNNNEVNHSAHGGKSIRTNTRKSKENYRCSGGYGEANKYNPHDRRQIDQLLYEMGDADEL